MSNIKAFQESSFDEDVLRAPSPVLVDFYADWCGPCKMMTPVVDEIAEKYGDRLVVGKLDVDQNATIAQRYQVMGIPTLGYFAGGKLVDRLVGFPGPAAVRAFVEKNLQRPAA
jgi:thioredoxin 1